MKCNMNTCQRGLGQVAGAVVLGFGLLVLTAPTISLADQQLPTMTVGLQTGMITAVYQTTFQIDGRTYSFTPDAEVFDDRGNQLDVGAIRADVEAKFHVKKDQIDKIDKLILVLPR